MNIFNFGSLNIDHVYQVPHFVKPGETLASFDYKVFAGGKGANQSVALARAGAPVTHIGKIGLEGRWLKDYLARAGVNISGVIESDIPTGHAIIQVTPQGENSIILFGGANQAVSESEIKSALAPCSAGDILLLQNEVNSTSLIMEIASQKGLAIVFNPAPMNSDVLKLPLSKVSYLILNETEGAAISGHEEPARVLSELAKMLPATEIILTLGEKGVLYGKGPTRSEFAAEKVKAVDTTAAGDTFIGYFLAEVSLGHSIDAAMRLANKAAAICVTRKGASDSIPLRAEI